MVGIDVLQVNAARQDVVGFLQAREIARDQVSTAAAGPGCECGSAMTPVGEHRVRAARSVPYSSTGAGPASASTRICWSNNPAPTGCDDSLPGEWLGERVALAHQRHHSEARVALGASCGTDNPVHHHPVFREKKWQMTTMTKRMKLALASCSRHSRDSQIQLLTRRSRRCHCMNA
jgi:hypothetical protein